jgi:choline dehydrogenase-like flavoprotein
VAGDARLEVVVSCDVAVAGCGAGGAAASAALAFAGLSVVVLEAGQVLPQRADGTDGVLAVAASGGLVSTADGGAGGCASYVRSAAGAQVLRSCKCGRCSSGRSAAS